jgi:hypothetical protein
MELADLFGMNRNTITRWELGLLRLPKIAHWAMKGLETEQPRTTRQQAGRS